MLVLYQASATAGEQLLYQHGVNNLLGKVSIYKQSKPLVAQ